MDMYQGTDEYFEASTQYWPELNARIHRTRRAGAPTRRIPKRLHEALARKEWPLGRLPGARFPTVWRATGCDLELEPSLETMERDGNLDFFRWGLLSDDRPASNWHVYEGTLWRPRWPLPWLDINRALVIGGGADCGDDLWLILDLRGRRDDPPVLFSVYTSNDGRRVEWRKAASTLSAFLRQARGVAFGPQRCRAPGRGSTERRTVGTTRRGWIERQRKSLPPLLRRRYRSLPVARRFHLAQKGGWQIPPHDGRRRGGDRRESERRDIRGALGAGRLWVVLSPGSSACGTRSEVLPTRFGEKSVFQPKHPHVLRFSPARGVP